MRACERIFFQKCKRARLHSLTHVREYLWARVHTLEHAFVQAHAHVIHVLQGCMSGPCQEQCQQRSVPLQPTCDSILVHDTSWCMTHPASAKQDGKQHAQQRHVHSSALCVRMCVEEHMSSRSAVAYESRPPAVILQELVSLMAHDL